MFISTLICYFNLIRSTSSTNPPEKPFKIEIISNHNLKISGGNFSDVSSLTPKIFASYSDSVQVLNISCTKMKEFPRGVECLKNLKTINCYGNTDMTDFTNLNNLPEEIRNRIYFIAITHSELEDIPIMFERFENLNILDLSCNKLKKIPDSIFLLPELGNLNLSHNRLEMLPTSFRNLSKLQMLWIEHNKIRDLGYDFIKLQNLTHLYANNNLFSKIPIPVCFLKTLQFINFDDNKIQSIFPTDEEKNKLIKMGEENQELHSYIDFNQDLNRQFYPKLRIINCSQNEITVVPDEIEYLTALNDINLSGNLIEKVSKALFKLPILEYLTLSKNKLRRLPLECVDMQTSEKSNIRLDISHNMMQALDNADGLGLITLKKKFYYIKDECQYELE